MTNYIILWVAVLVFTGAIEAISVQLISIWFSISSLVALVLAVLQVSFWIQVVVFIVLGVALLFATRPVAKKIYSFGIKHTNDVLAGQKFGVIVQTVDPAQGKGRVRVGDTDWIAISENGEIIEKDTEVVICRSEGNKVYVMPKGISQ